MESPVTEFLPAQEPNSVAAKAPDINMHLLWRLSSRFSPWFLEGSLAISIVASDARFLLISQQMRGSS